MVKDWRIEPDYVFKACHHVGRFIPVLAHLLYCLGPCLVLERIARAISYRVVVPYAVVRGGSYAKKKYCCKKRDEYGSLNNVFQPFAIICVLLKVHFSLGLVSLSVLPFFAFSNHFLTKRIKTPPPRYQ